MGDASNKKVASQKTQLDKLGFDTSVAGTEQTVSIGGQTTTQTTYDEEQLNNMTNFSNRDADANAISNLTSSISGKK
jgi:hypothetical protein